MPQPSTFLEQNGRASNPPAPNSAPATVATPAPAPTQPTPAPAPETLATTPPRATA